MKGARNKMQTTLIIMMLLCSALMGYGFGYFQSCKDNEKSISEYYDFAQRCLKHADECLQIMEKYKESEK